MSELIYPKYYHCRFGISDKKWIFEKMAYIPDDKKQEVANKYENLYLQGGNGRKRANEYLAGIAKEYWQVMFNGKQKA